MRYFLLFVCLFATIFADAQPFKISKRLEAVYATYTDDNNQQHGKPDKIYYEPTLGKPITEKELGPAPLYRQPAIHGSAWCAQNYPKPLG